MNTCALKSLTYICWPDTANESSKLYLLGCLLLSLSKLVSTTLKEKHIMTIVGLQWQYLCFSPGINATPAENSSRDTSPIAATILQSTQMMLMMLATLSSGCKSCNLWHHLNPASCISWAASTEKLNYFGFFCTPEQ